jgi:hypothetical protein
MEIYVEVGDPAFRANDRVDRHHLNARVATPAYREVWLQRVQVIQRLGPL